MSDELVTLRAAVSERLSLWAFRHSGAMSRALLFRSGSRPWERESLDVSLHELDIGVGDALMCTPVFRELKRVNPRCRIRFYNGFPSLLKGLPYIDEILPFDARPSDTIVIGYCGSTTPPRRMLVAMLGDRLGVDVRDNRPDCIIDEELVQQWKRAWETLPRPHVIVNRYGNPWTPNKDWPSEYWETLLDRLTADCGVIEIGNRKDEGGRLPARNYVDLRGTTSLEEFVAAVAAADVHVGPISGPVHIAAAAGVPSVVIYGGFEHPADTSYAGNVDLYTPVVCAPCWLSTPCPYERRCLREIAPETVLSAVRTLWERRVRALAGVTNNAQTSAPARHRA